jgi:hypothetical protein
MDNPWSWRFLPPPLFPRGGDGRLFSDFGGDHGGRGGYLPPHTSLHAESSWE